MTGPESLAQLLDRVTTKNRYRHLIEACSTRQQCMDLANLLAGNDPAEEERADILGAMWILGHRTAGFPGD